MNPQRIIYLIAALTICLAMIASYFALRRDFETNRQLNSEALATIEDVDVRRTTDPVFGDERSVDVTVTYSYEIQGKKYQRKTRIPKSQAESFVPWGNAKVCYSAADPRSIDEGRLFPPGHRCGDD